MTNPALKTAATDFQVLPHESQSDFETLVIALYEEFSPQAHEVHLIDQMAQSQWRIRRVDRLENKAFDAMLGEPDDSPDARIIAHMSQHNRDPLSLLLRYKAAAERTYYKALRQLQQDRRADQSFQKKAMDQYIKDYVYGPKPTPNGFASQNAPTPPPAARPKAASLGNLALRL